MAEIKVPCATCLSTLKAVGKVCRPREKKPTTSIYSVIKGMLFNLIKSLFFLHMLIERSYVATVVVEALKLLSTQKTQEYIYQNICTSLLCLFCTTFA